MENVNRSKILFLVTQSEFGGAQRYIFEMVSNLDKQKYDILVAAGQGDGELFKKIQNIKYQIQNTPVRTIQLKWLKRTPYPVKAFLSIMEIFNLLRKERPYTLFLCSTTAGLLGSLSSKIYKFTKPYTLDPKPYVIYRIGGWSFLDPRPSWINRVLFLLEKLTAAFKDKIIVNSEIDKEIAIKYKICPSEKIVKIYNGVDTNQLQFLSKTEARQKLSESLPETCNLKPETFVIGTVANFYKTKGLEYLIKSAHILKTRFKFQVSGFKILIIGDGKQRESLESLIRKYNLEDKIILLGRIPNAYKYLKSFDIFILPSLKEGFPWIILEAMASEVPVISTNVGALPEIIKDNVNGLLIKPKNSQALAEKIIWVLNNKEKAQKMALEAKKSLENFSLKKMVQETKNLL